MTVANDNNRNIGLAAIYFFLSTVITWWFIDCGSSLYQFDQHKMMLSCSIAGAKWAIQIFGALLFLKEKRWIFIRNIAATCFVGSCILLPFCFASLRAVIPGKPFLSSLIASVAVMIAHYYYGVRKSGVPVKWYFLWLACLAVAISLQLTVVFHLI